MVIKTLKRLTSTQNKTFRHVRRSFKSQMRVKMTTLWPIIEHTELIYPCSQWSQILTFVPRPIGLLKI